MTTGSGAAPALTGAERDELDALRRRGYGPGEGLAPRDAARLRALEERVLDPRTPVEPGDAPDTPSAPPEAPRDPRASRDRGRPRHPVVLALAAIAAAGLLVALGYALAERPTDVDAGSLAPVTLDPDGAAVVTGTASFAVRHLDPDSLVQYDSLGQGTPWSASNADGGRCLILTVTDDSPEMFATAGVWDVACAPAGLSPIVDWEVDPSFPSPPQDLPDGSVVRLTLEDDRVRLSIGRAG